MIAEKETWKDKLDDWALDHVPGVLYRIPFRVRDFYHYIIHLIQRLFRKNHTSNRDLWNLDYHLAKVILPKLKAFYEMGQSSYPSIFSDYRENTGFESKEEYDKSGMLGGGAEAWKAILKEILFAFDYLVYSDLNNKKTKALYKRWELEDPHEEKEENKTKGLFNISFYYNVELAMEYQKRATEGFKLFGNYFESLWD